MQGRRAKGRLLLAARAALAGSLLVLTVGLLQQSRRLEAFAASPYPVTRLLPFHPQVGRWASPGRIDLDRVDLPYTQEFRRGQTVEEVLRGLGLAPSEAYAASRALAEHVDLRRIKSGDPYVAVLDPDSRLKTFHLYVPERGVATAWRDAEAWRSAFREFHKEVRRRIVEGRLDGYLEASILEAGGPPPLAYEMAYVLQWDLDFNRDLRRGDRFRVLYEEVYYDGEYDSLGNILALQYESRGRLLEAYRYGDAGGYYDGAGRPLKKMFLRSPLRFSRITSSFSRRRFHPVLKRYRPHYGVDYGAPVGTPVRVTANGTVTFAGWDRGGGRTVKVRHANGYLTAYLHLSRIAKGIRPGRRVSQEEVVGYVGATGLATGPHLDYRVQHRGRWIDPLSLRNLPADPIPAKERDAFEAWRDLLRASLDSGIPPPSSQPPPRETMQVASGRPPADVEAAAAGAR